MLEYHGVWLGVSPGGFWCLDKHQPTRYLTLAYTLKCSSSGDIKNRKTTSQNMY